MPGDKEKKTDKPAETEKLLDDTLDDSFPASDPPSVTRAPADKRETKDPPPEEEDDRK